MKFMLRVTLLVALLLVTFLCFLWRYGPDYHYHLELLILWLLIIEANLLALWYIHWIIQEHGFSALPGSRIGWYVGGYGVSPCAFFLGYIGGVTIGGALMAGFIKTIGGPFGGMIGNILNTFLSMVGIGSGVFIVTAGTCLAGALLGYLLGGSIHRLVRLGQRLGGH